MLNQVQVLTLMQIGILLLDYVDQFMLVGVLTRLPKLLQAPVIQEQLESVAQAVHKLLWLQQQVGINLHQLRLPYSNLTILRHHTLVNILEPQRPQHRAQC